MKPNITLPLVVLCLAALIQPLYAEHDDAPSRRDLQQVRRHASDLERAADNFVSALKPTWNTHSRGHDDDRHDRDHGRHKGDRDRLISIAERFSREAEDFDDTVDRNKQRPERTVDAFRQLRRSYLNLQDAARRVRLDSREERAYYKLRGLFESISRYYIDSGRPDIDWRRVQSLAHEIDERADDLYADARRDLSRYAGHYSNSRVREAVWRFEELRNAARHFHRQVERNRRDRDHIRSDFERLLATYDYANRYIWYLSYETRRDLARLGSLIDELDSRCYDGSHRRRHVDARPYDRIPGQAAPKAQTVSFEEAWPQLLISLLGGDVKL